MDPVALMVDGIRVAEHTWVVALGITLDGTKVPLALAEGATENATVVTEVLVGLGDRGLDLTRPILVVIDGAKALRRAVTEVFDHPVIQRLKLHKLRNLTDRLPKALASTVAKRMRRAYHLPDPLVAQAELEALARELGRAHPAPLQACARGWPRPWPSAGWACHPPRSNTAQHQHHRVDDRDLPRPCQQRPSAGRTGRWCCAGSPPAWARPPDNSAASMAICTCRRCASPSTRPSLLSHPARRMPPDHP